MTDEIERAAIERVRVLARYFRELAPSSLPHNAKNQRADADALDALLSSLAARDDEIARLRGDGWREIASAKKNGTPILAKFYDDIYPRLEPKRPDLERWNGRHVVIRHSGLADDGFDIGWSMNAPVGHGGFPDEWIEGWRPLPPPGETP